ncbi:hypothetical protein TSUD_250210 [Trifolium subterraneum]|nr:hypothetical protein TSUD_250210 [Trifolium subterraneum]
MFEGTIPTSKQFGTFGSDSYGANPKLCGFPLSKSCNNDEGQPLPSTSDDEEESILNWKAVAIGYACGAVFGILLGYYVFLTGKPQWLGILVEKNLIQDDSCRGHRRFEPIIKVVVYTDTRWPLCFSTPSKIESWNSSTDCCEWIGVTCNTVSGHVIILDLSCSRLEGKFSSNSTIFQLKQLQQLNLAFIDFSGSSIYPGIGDLENLTHLNLSSTRSTIHWIARNFPTNILSLPNLEELGLSNNQDLSGQLPKYNWSTPLSFDGLVPLSLGNLTQLTFLGLAGNNLKGPIPTEITKRSKLILLYLADNMLNGTIPHWCYSLPSLLELDLSDNQLTDLSNNKIQGKVPKWFHESLYTWKEIEFIDLSFNKLQGDLLIPHYGIQQFSLSNNNFTGDIALSLCDVDSLTMLNLAHNSLTGMIPQCLGTFPFLSIFDMQMNNLYGSMPKTFSKENSFQTIKLNGNQLEGLIPQSLAHCTKLEVLDLGDNNIEDIFPNWLETLQELQVLSLRSNELHGSITCSSTKHPFPKLRIFYVSNNNFSGPLPTSCFKNFQGMMNVIDDKTGLQYMGVAVYYNDSVVVTIKGLRIELTRILTTFTTIDLSNNKFEGEIPQVIGELKSLKGLNLSNNGITGTIPQSLSYLRNLEWLDLSRNQLRGDIPMTLTNLNFLSFLNLSQNHLVGIIPKGQQFDTFGNDSYEGNTMLCGFPLSKSCKNDEGRQPHSTSEDEEESGFGWKAVAIGYACGAIFGLLLGHNVFFYGKPEWLARFVEHMFNMRLKRTNNGAGANRRRMN